MCYASNTFIFTDYYLLKIMSQSCINNNFLNKLDSVFARHCFEMSWNVNRQGFDTLHSREVNGNTISPNK